MARDLREIFDATNVADLLEKEELDKFSQRAVQGYEADEESRSEWKERNKEGMKLAMQISSPKNSPFEDAANVMYPLISISSIQFSARAYPNLVPSYDIVRAKVIGADATGEKANKAKRIETHMNWQLNEEIDEWEEETDRLLTVLPIMGCCFKETYWSVNQKRIVSRYIAPNDIVMHYKAESMATVPRITKKYYLYPNEIEERIRAGIFLSFDIGQPQKAKEEGETYSNNDEYRPHLFLEQHTYLDLDGDGYSEPYILNIHFDTKNIVRIVPRFDEGGLIYNSKGEVQRIEARQYYTKFTFMHSPDGAIYDWGFGSLLAPINHTVNSTINQQLDAATWGNTPTGWITKNISLGAGKHGGPVELEFGKFLPINYSGDDLHKNIVLANEFIPPPSAVLFTLLSFMVNAGERLSSVSELMQGEQSVHNEPATTSLARIEQGQKVFSAIHKRLYKSLNSELHKIFALNAEKLEDSQYFTILDEPDVEQGIARSDYDKTSCDIIPTASPDDVSNSQKMIKAQLLMSLTGQGFNDAEIKKRFIEALQIANPQTILEGPPPPPDPKLVLESEKLDLERDKFEFEMMMARVEMAKRRSEIVLNLAKAEAAEAGPQMERYLAEMDALVALATAQQGKKPAPTEAGAMTEAGMGGNGGEPPS